MKTYYIFELNIEEKCYLEGEYYKLKKVTSGWHYIGDVTGAKALFSLFKNNYKRAISICLNDFVDGKDLPLGCYYLITDKNLKILDAKEIFKNFYKKRQKDNYAYRKDPVPGVHKGKWCFGCYYRHFPKKKDVVNKREINNLKKEYPCAKIKVQRDKRKTIPDTWDDIVRSTTGLKNWKHFRKKQYKK